MHSLHDIHNIGKEMMLLEWIITKESNKKDGIDD